METTNFHEKNYSYKNILQLICRAFYLYINLFFWLIVQKLSINQTAKKVHLQKAEYYF